MKIGEIPRFYLHNYIIGDPNVVPCTMRIVYRSDYEIISEWDPESTYVVQRPWDPGGPTLTEQPTYIDQAFLSIYKNEVRQKGTC